MGTKGMCPGDKYSFLQYSFTTAVTRSVSRRIPLATSTAGGHGIRTSNLPSDVCP